MKPEEYVAIPLPFTVEPIKGADGVWRFRAEYLDIEGSAVESDFVPDVMDSLERRRTELTVEMLARNKEPPSDRQPLAFLVPEMRELVQSVMSGATETGEANEQSI